MFAVKELLSFKLKIAADFVARESTFSKGKNQFSFQKEINSNLVLSWRHHPKRIPQLPIF